jgi:hypothetical protein
MAEELLPLLLPAIADSFAPKTDGEGKKEPRKP